MRMLYIKMEMQHNLLVWYNLNLFEPNDAPNGIMVDKIGHTT